RMLWSQTNVKTNVHALIGRQVDVIETVNASSGRVKLDGEVWSARTIDEKPLLVGEHAYVCEIDGATAVVTSVENRSKTFEEQKG
ncbi:MAG: NfeD family protein, partial [Actinomycetaceae bacterium UMB1218B]|nr:NfeD family protein [Actinomycetaceae bacterium UMB1218B]